MTRLSTPTSTGTILGQNAYFAAHSDAGCFIHSINQVYGGIKSTGSPTRVPCKSLSTLTTEEIAFLAKFCIIVPLQNASKATIDTFSFLAREGLVNAINEKRCKLAIDFSNESCSLHLYDRLNSILESYGVINTSHCAILSQNRQLNELQTSKAILKPFCFDFFPLATLSYLRKTVSEANIHELVTSRHSVNKPGDILCLNATPRLHRIITLLMLIKVGLIDKEQKPFNTAIRCPFVSFPGFSYSKTGGLTAEATKQELTKMGLDDRLEDLEWLLSVSPLKVDDLAEEGNQLATKIILKHYVDTHLSVVNETGTDNSARRLTEKSLKPLALGHPFVIIGHLKSVELARELGFSTMDHIIDHGYDSQPDPLQRTAMAVQSAKRFIAMIHSGEIRSSDIMPHSTHNINWAREGLLEHYYIRFVLPIIRFLEFELP
jgi:hypothetical protein